MARPSVYEFAGGDDAFLRLATAHHEGCLADPLLEHPFSHGTHPDHIARLAAYLAEVFGGPPAYTEIGGGHSPMLRIHAGTGAPPEFGTAFVACFVDAADVAGLPADPAFRAVLRAYMEWAVADVMSYAPEGSVVRPAQSVPHWSWDGLVDGPT